VYIYNIYKNKNAFFDLKNTKKDIVVRLWIIGTSGSLGRTGESDDR
jgi:hypothetical protein